MTISTRSRQTIVRSILLALCYFLAGRLGLLLAIPPGYASAIFPSSGIALAALLLFGNRLFLGVFLGSFLLNLTMSPSWLSIFSVGGAIAVCIAIGSTLQALIGASLIRRCIGTVGTLNDFIDYKDIFRFYLIGGPISCLISATNGTATLYFAGAITLQSVTFNWFSWWIGDVIGVFIMVPFIFCMFAHPRELWKIRTRTLVPLLTVSFISVVLVFINVSNWEINEQRKDFNVYTSNIVNSLHSKTMAQLTLMKAVERLVTVTGDLNHRQFNQFISPLLNPGSGIQALEWLPVVKGDDRLFFEKKIKSEGFPHFQIRELNTKSELVPAHRADEYIPITFIEPYSGNEAVLGYDLASNPLRLKMLSQARDSGNLIGTGRFKLTQQKIPQDDVNFGFLLVRPVYDTSSTLKTTAQRIEHIRGYILILLNIYDIFKTVEDELNVNGITLQVVDENEEKIATDKNNEQPLIFQMTNWKNALTNIGLSQINNLTIGARSWRLEFYPLPNYLVAHRSRQSWATLAGGLFLTGFLGFIILLITGQTEKLNRNVKERTNELRIIIDNIVDGIVTINENNLISSLNPAAEKIFGYKAHEIIGRDVRILMSEKSAMNLSRYSRTNFDPEGDNTLTYHEIEGLRKDKSTFQIEFASSCSTHSGKPLFVAVVRDVTERARVARIKNDFISTVSHELRTPLTSISGALGLIGSGVCGALSAQTKQMIDMAHKNSLRLTMLINDLLDIEKSAAGKMTLKMELQPLLPLVNQALDSISAYGAQYNVTCTLVEHEEVSAMVDGNRLVQVLNNFLSNAIKFSTTGGSVDVKIRTLLRSDKTVVRVEVIDHGAGIPLKFKHHIFQKFSQADSSDTKQKGGTGLGLAISKDLIELMNGKIGFESEEGLGTCFYFEFPIPISTESGPLLPSKIRVAEQI